MFKRNVVIWRVIGAVLLLALLVGGGYLVYRAGVAAGIRQAPEMAEVFSNALESGQWPAAGVEGFGYPGGHFYKSVRGHSPFGFFGLLLMAFLFFGLLRFVFFRHRYWGYGPHPMYHGPWKGPWGPWDSEREEEKGAERDESARE
jgi:hypothetical protein